MFKEMVAAAISLAIVFQGISHPVRVEAATCSVVGGQSGRLKYSGQLGKTSATVCGNQIWKLIGKPAPPKKPSKPVKPSKPIKYVNQFTVIPDQPTIVSLSGLQAKLGEPLTFQSLAVRHTRNRMLLWYPTQVNFTPKTIRWDFGDGQSGAATLQSHQWLQKGIFNVRAEIGFSVEYRIVGKSAWVALPGTLSVFSNILKIEIGESQPTVNQKVVLVHWNCFQKSFAKGC